MSTPTWVMQRAGILGSGLKPDEPIDKLTPYAKYQFIQEIIEELMFGTPSIPFVCGNVAPTNLASSVQDLHDEQKYFQFHRNWVDTYEKIAIGLNHPGSILLPVFDVTFMFPDIDIKIPDLPGLDLPTWFADWLADFTIKFPNLAADIPKLLLKLPQFPPKLVIDLPIPPKPFGINLPQLSFMFEAILKIPSLIIEFAFNLTPLDIFPFDFPKFFAKICKLVKEKVAPPHPDNEGVLDVTNVAAGSVLARKTAELVMLSVLGMVVGSGLIIVPGVSNQFGYTSSEPEADISPYLIEAGLRGKIISTAMNVVGLHSSQVPHYSSVLKEYAAYLFPNDSETDRIGWVSKSGFSACGCFVRATYRQAAGGDIFESNPGGTRAQLVNLPYKNRVGKVISDLRELAKSRGGIKYDIEKKPRKKVENLDIQQGDTIFVANYTEGASLNLDSGSTHVLLVIEEISNKGGSRTFSGVQGGTSNFWNDPNGGPPRADTYHPTAGQRFSDVQVTFVQQLDGKIKVQGDAGNRFLVEIWDAEKTIVG